jgi:hypothetical protein
VADLKVGHYSRREKAAPTWSGPLQLRPLPTVLGSKRGKRRRFTLVEGALKLST